MNITVFLGANEGNDPSLKRAARELGKWIGQSGNTLVYGGSRPGLMGELAESALSVGGNVIGVQVDLFVREECYPGLPHLLVTRDLAERKQKMIELGDAFLAFPGGTGTLDEITEVISMVSLEMIQKPCILLNLNGYYRGLQVQLQQMIAAGLSTEDRQKNIFFVDDVEQVERILAG